MDTFVIKHGDYEFSSVLGVCTTLEGAIEWCTQHHEAMTRPLDAFDFDQPPVEVNVRHCSDNLTVVTVPNDWDEYRIVRVELLHVEPRDRWLWPPADPAPYLSSPTRDTDTRKLFAHRYIGPHCGGKQRPNSTKLVRGIRRTERQRWRVQAQRELHEMKTA